MAQASPTAPPVIEALTPDHGDAGTVVTASGTGLVPGATSVAENHVRLVDPDQVTVDPAGTTATFTVASVDRTQYFFGGQLRLSLVTPAGESNQLSFTVQAHLVSYGALHPSSGPTRGGPRSRSP